MIFKSCKLKDIVVLNYGKSLPERDRKPGDFPVYGSGGEVGTNTKSLVNGPGIILGRKGSIGSVYYSNKDFFPIDTVYFVTPKSEDIDLRYAYYLLKSLPLKTLNTDAAVPGLNRNIAYDVSVKVPDFEHQKRMVKVLEAYDDLIENNNRRIALLEESARLLYQEWFVHLRFPGHEHCKIIDGVPEGWTSTNLVDIANLTMGQSPKSEFYNDRGEGLPFHQGVTNYGFRYVTDQTYCTKETRIAETGDILCSVRAPVGRLNITQNKMILGRGLAGLRSKDGHQSFLFYSLKSFFFKEDIIGNGAIYASVTKKDMESIQILKPSNLVLKEYEDIASSIDSQILNLSIQIQKLIEARDILLPRLMNGEIVV